MSENIFKRTLRGLFRKMGYDIVNRTLYGRDLLRDLDVIFADQKTITILDIGANIGQTTLELAAHFGNAAIHSIEPDPEAHTQLTAAVKGNPRVKTYNIGFGDRNATATLNINKGSGGNSLLDLSEKIHTFAQGDWTEKAGERDVTIVTLDTFCEQQSIPKIDLMKIDTQGYEKIIFEGGPKTVSPAVTKAIFIEVLFVELYKDQAYFEDIYALLTAKGYKLVGFYNPFRKAEVPHELMWCDALFVG